MNAGKTRSLMKRWALAEVNLPSLEMSGKKKKRGRENVLMAGGPRGIRTVIGLERR